MKKIFYFLLLMISGIVWGQISQFNNLCTNNSNLSLSNTYYEYKFKTPASCSQDQTNSYKSINYYKVVVDGSFEFTLNSTKLVNYHVWVLNDAEINNFFLNKESRYEALRSSYSSLTTEKGLFNSATDECEFYGSADGKLKPLIVSAGQYVVIGVLGLDVNTNFTITPGGTAIVCEPEPVGGNTELSGKCFSEVYTISEVKDKVKSQISVDHSQIVDVNKIKIFNSVTSTDEITTDINSSIGLGQTYIAKVYDNRNVEIYRYTVTINFKAGYNFYFTDYTYEVCGKNYVVNYKDIIEKHVTDYTDVNNFRINYVEYGGVRYSDGQTINFSDDLVRMNVSITYIGTDLCESTDDFQIDIRDVKHYNLYTPEIITTCNSKFTINKFDLRIKTQVINDEDYDLKFYLSDGTEVYENNEIDIISGQLNLTYQAVHYRTGCLGEKGTLIIKQTSKANILPAEIKDICLADFTQIHVDNTIDRIQNGNNYNLKYYQEDSLVEITDLFTYIKTTKNGKIIVKALAVDNGNTICDTDVELTFELDESNFELDNDIPTFNSLCSEVGAGHITTTKIEDYLKNYFGRTDIVFNGIVDEILPDNGSKTITFQVKINGEQCWSDEMQLTLQVITKPNVVSAIYSDKFCEGETLTIDDNLLRDNFGANAFDYKIYIDGSEYIQGNSIQKVLHFGTNTSLNISVEFKNRLSDTCSTTVDLSINKKQDLVVDIATLENYTQANPIIYCEGEDENAKSQIKSILDIINKPTQYPNLVAKSSVDEIFAQIDSNGGFVNVDFEDPNYCGTATIKFYFKRNPLPTITVPATDDVCSGDLYDLDFTTQTDYDKYYYEVEKEDGTRILGTYIFELDAGNYKITIEDKLSGCSIVKTLVVSPSELPTIEKITINEKSVIVSAKGNGKLEYALFDSKGDIIIDWQTKNELIIPDNIKNNDFTVRVRLNNCGVSERKNVTYLALPNVVTPNNDGFNDVWQPMTKDGKVTDTSNSYKLIIFDRYGKQILTQEGTDIIKWDGTLNGKPVADGTYWYLLESNEELQVLYSGYIVVKRKIN